MILRCKVEDDRWIALQLEEKLKGGKVKIIPIEETDQLIDTPKVVAVRLSTGQVLDFRQEAPYFQILPCPHCGVEEDKEHDPLKHVDPNLGHICSNECPQWCIEGKTT